MKYQQKLENMIDFIGKHLDEELSLESLSEIFCISKFHFHRLFTAFTGLSLQQYIKWLRLKRAAHQLIVEKDQSVINIAINAGFESHEAFSRAFKKACGFSPSQFRQGFGRSYWEQPPYCLPRQGRNDMKVDIKSIDKIRLAVIEHKGDPKLLGESINKLVSWAKSQSINLKPRPGEAFALAYDDPKTTPPSEFRIDLGIKVPENLKLDGMIEKFLPSGRYAVTVHKGSRNNIGDVVYYLYRDWLPNTSEQLGDLPCIFCYYNFDHEVAETELLTECWLLLK
ncbi:AraC family transcriptional regulator [Legionella pneumophila]|uniref:AraC family transcriptional regulator n=1 Tax=Legionella pneumophila subsp. pascullei TaxID=91890 RepID=A0AAX2IYN3_LEGPN|nr:GyrI-like domain-containing protein [Legionella pneumophila]AMP89268.1 AraC family transcriptional regulator [Legionella pneumophila subsp. pascullei]AMP93064.1 AraC family transcriptional regulator [Legionella pneumophila subsp. pascullei]AMP96030.1 AraC family transcriptional regulator [Legionella pneumophila subsp. pascullei]SQG90967.1 AraC family transcriptional regulator [Legionella pneumophila subsp. pascullei]VEH07512.1 AraC family transcriptional regulator [Legionella pneumophila su